MTWDDLDWKILDRLRTGFLTGAAAEGPYWQSPADLAQYDFTFAERIGWKWDHVLRELRQRDWSPSPGPLLDWGCGSGIAHRRVLEAWPEAVTEVRLFDHSLLAQDYAAARLRDVAPDLPVGSWERSSKISTLVISHVLNELDEDSAADLMATLAKVDTVIWLEPGTSDVAGKLVGWREKLVADFEVIYPCPHQKSCGMMSPENARHWCHHFAAPPPEVGADSNWVKFGQRAGIDLRSLPYSALVLDRNRHSPSAPAESTLGRIIGRPKVSKPYTRFLGCDQDAVQMLELPKRLAPALAKRLDRPATPRLLHWRQENGTVTRITEPDSTP